VSSVKGSGEMIWYDGFIWHPSIVEREEGLV
jgi:hypothetical protein